MPTYVLVLPRLPWGLFFEKKPKALGSLWGNNFWLDTLEHYFRSSPEKQFGLLAWVVIQDGDLWSTTEWCLSRKKFYSLHSLKNNDMSGWHDLLYLRSKWLFKIVNNNGWEFAEHYSFKWPKSNIEGRFHDCLLALLCVLFKITS